jgi:type VI secretion system protein ImpL
MIDAATRTRKDGGAVELRWEKGNVAVSVDLKIVSNIAGGDDGYRGLRLPDAFVGRTALAAIGSAGGQ